MIDCSLSLKGRIREINLKKECGMHSEMTITVVPDDLNSISELFSFADTGTYVEADYNGKIIMCGKVRQITGRTTYSGAAVSVLVVSDSIESDIAKTSRVFQSPEKNYQSVFDKASAKVKFEIKKEELKSKTEENVIVQENETDFEFACRIANEQKTRLFDIANEKGQSKVIIADSITERVTLEDEKIISAKVIITDYNEIIDLEYRYAESGHDSFIELGTTVILDGQEYVVVALQAVRKNGLDRFFMKIEKKQKETEDSTNSIGIISLGKAKVTDNKDTENLGRIQVEFLELEDSLNDKKIWIQYINTFTSAEGGVFFIPDKDELVDVLLQNGICYAYGCIREKAASEKINNTDNKSMMLFNKVVMFEEKKITLTAGEYTACINEDENELIVNNKKYRFNMKNDSVVIGNDNNTVTIGDDTIRISSNSKGNIEIKESSVIIDVNNKGKITVTDQNIKNELGNSNMTLSSGKLDISATSGVEVSTSQFNVK